MAIRRSIDYDKELNEEQREVVFHEGSPMLVIAGAGSGKTRVVTYRVVRLLEKGVSPRNILLLTFTNKAAREMLRRVHDLVRIDTEPILGGTFHHVGNIILRHHAGVFGYKRNFTIIDNEDAEDLIDLIIKEEKLDGKRFPKGEVLKEIFSFFVNTLKKDMEEAIFERAPYFLELREEIERVYQLYMERKMKMNAMDFDDLLLFWWRLFLEYEDIRKYYASLFSHVLVDEYQDTNKIQAEIVDLMGKTGKNLMVVGDDAQSIYSFRGARFENIMDFPSKYPEVKIFKLEKNYRSTPEILKLANASIIHNERQFHKNLFSVRRRGNLPVVVCLRDKLDEASFVANKILRFKEEGTPLGEIAVLYRAHFQCMELQMELTRRGIPFEVRSGLRFFEQAHIKDVTAFLRVMANPFDEISWKRCLRIFPGIGRRISTMIWEVIRKEENPLKIFVEGRAVEKIKKIGENNAALMSEIFSELSEFMKKKSPSLMINVVLKRIYKEYLFYTFPNPESRLEDLEQLANFATLYDDLEAFLSDLSLMGTMDNDLPLSTVEKERVVLSTIHQAKGLEWKVVFLIGCNEGRFPHRRSVEEGNIEEERRLFYVATTRAKDALFICYETYDYDRYSDRIPLAPSRFIKEIPERVYERLNLL